MNFVYPLLVLLLAVFAIAPLEYPGAFQSHSGLLAVYNLIDIDQNPVQVFHWAPTIADSFDVFRSEGALPYFVAEIIHWAGLSYLDAIKLVYALAFATSGMAMYALARRFVSQPGALLASAVYVYLPFHIAAVYVRGAFAEATAWAIFPIALSSVLALGSSIRRNKKTYLLVVLSFAALFLSLPGLAVIFAASTLAIIAVLQRSMRMPIGSAFIGVSSGIGLGLVLELPTIIRYGSVITRNGFVPHYVMFFQLISSMWGYGPSTGDYLDQFPLQIGVVPLGLAVIALALAFRGTPPTDGNATARRAVVAFLSYAIIAAFLTSEIAAPLWSLLGLFLTYPWQLLALVGLAIAIVAGTVLDLDDRLNSPAMLAALVALPIVASYSYLALRPLDLKPTRPQVAVFGDHEIALLDYRIVGPLRHGATVRLQLQWQALRQVDHDYTVFVHAVNDDGNTYAQEDSKPVDGALPTIKWTPGQVVSDTHTIQIDVDGPREGYILEVGLYQGASGRRAFTETGADHLSLPRPGDPEPTISDQLPLASR